MFNNGEAMYEYQIIHDIYMLLDDGDRQVLQQYGLTIGQYAILRLLAMHDGLRLTDLSIQLRRDKSVITRTVDRMEFDGLVVRLANPGDRRAQSIRMTEYGHEQLKQAQQAHEQSLLRRMHVLSEGERVQLEQLLHKLRAGLRAELTPTFP